MPSKKKTEIVLRHILSSSVWVQQSIIKGVGLSLFGVCWELVGLGSNLIGVCQESAGLGLNLSLSSVLLELLVGLPQGWRDWC